MQRTPTAGHTSDDSRKNDSLPNWGNSRRNSGLVDRMRWPWDTRTVWDGDTVEIHGCFTEDSHPSRPMRPNRHHQTSATAHTLRCVTEEKKRELARIYAALNPVILLKQIRQTVEYLWTLGKRSPPVSRADHRTTSVTGIMTQPRGFQ